MRRILAALTLLVCAAAHAATINTTVTVTATVGFSGTSLSASGPATFTGGIPTGTFTSSIDLTAITGTSINAPFTVTFPGGADTLKGTLSVPAALVSGGATSGSGSATITGGTGAYAGATGSFATLAGTATGSIVSTLTLTFSGAGTITTGGGGPTGPPAPSITAVLDGASYSKNVAQGSLFIVKGSNLASAAGLNQFSFPLPATSGGVKITFTPVAGGAGTDAYLVYTYNQGGVNQLAAILPSTVAVGNYNVTVTNGSNGTSAGFATQVVQRKLTLITRDSSGTGMAVIQQYTSATSYFIDSLTNAAGGTGPAKPGGVLVAWSTGMGPVTGSDNTASPGFDFSKNGVTVRVLVGGLSITPDYAGRAPGLAGADQINFTLPANVPTGCTVPLQVSVNGALSNPTTIAIAPDANAAACVQPGFTTAQLQKFDQGGTYTVGAFGLSQISQTVPQFGNVKFNAASGGFYQYSGLQLGGASQNVIISSGACTVTHNVTTQGQAASCSSNFTGLDAGAITLNGPAGSQISNLAFKQNSTPDSCTGKNLISYSLTLASEGLPSIPGVPAGTGTIVAGTYTLNGAGGADVGKFSGSVTIGAPLTITGGLPSTVNRSAGLTLNWTGGNATDIVEILGSSSSVTGSGTSAVTDTWTFTCLTTAGPGTFTVPASILTQLPAATISANGSGGGFLEVVSTPNLTSSNGLFSAPLTAGGTIDYGQFFALIGIGGQASYQ